MIDAHCHLQFEQFDHDRENIIHKIDEKLDLAVIAGISHEDNKKAVEAARKSDKIICCLGAHPLYEHDNLNAIKNQIKARDVAAVGEIGLDYNYITDKDERKHSEKVLREMLSLAEDLGLNVVIHSRNAERKCFEIVKEYDVEGFFHCFNGNPQLAKEIFNNGHYIGVTGQIVHSSRVKNIVKELPVEALLTETDSPYLGEDNRNTPLFVEKVVEEIAEIKGIHLSKVEESVESNAENFFRY